MEQFNLDTWLQDKSRKVATRDGREVEIYYSPTSRIPLIGKTSDNKIHQYTEDGFQYDIINEAKNDLFFADEEEELTEFEKRVLKIIDSISLSCNTELKIKTAKVESKVLLDLARKELEKEDWRKPLRVYKNGYKQGKQDALKDLPKWKKSTKILPENPYLTFYPSDGHRELCVNGFEINIEELFETLPKEE